MSNRTIKFLTSPSIISTPTSVLPALNHEISPDEWPGVYAELVQAFKLIDRDDDGKIRKEELEALLSQVGAEPPTREELRLMLSEVDRDGDGCISLEEFSVLSSAFAPPSCDSELRDAFDFFDTDHDGKITAEELFNVFRTIGDSRCTLEDCRRMIVGVDNNGDGFVCFEDFCRARDEFLIWMKTKQNGVSFSLNSSFGACHVVTNICNRVRIFVKTDRNYQMHPSVRSGFNFLLCHYCPCLYVLDFPPIN
ncbi:probable calcium-binding protein CML36 [Ipomoea triloba]|uniref:probable calcium-binding protein CML36 n=1 Tax=Ipomoea triloba TaxID=35885 RepID=UPI00125E05D6|nr:probable calcium-binding protein CML36 [Ipomoea triloba]